MLSNIPSNRIYRDNSKRHCFNKLYNGAVNSEQTSMIILVEDLFFDAIDNDFLVLCTKTVMTGESKNYRHVNDNPIATKEGVSNLIRKILKYERPACIYTDIYQYSNKKLKERITI